MLKVTRILFWFLMLPAHKEKPREKKITVPKEYCTREETYVWLPWYLWLGNVDQMAKV